MRLVADDGRVINAEFALEREDGGRVAVILESAGGASGPQRSRNRDYPEALATLLRRLSVVDAHLHDVLVDSRRTRHLPPQARRVHPSPWSYPIQLGGVDDFDRLRKAITRPQGDIGSTSKTGGGNGRKRIRLTFAVPRSSGLDAVKALLRAVDYSDQEAEEIAPEVVDARLAAEVTAGRPGRGQGFKLDVKAKLAIEKHAITVTTAFLTDQGFNVENVGATQSFDLDARRGDERLHVEVKGTTSSGSHVILTRGEVALHTVVYPDNALAIVHSINVAASSKGPVRKWWAPGLAEPMVR